jgi:hypothetical protein
MTWVKCKCGTWTNFGLTCVQCRGESSSYGSKEYEEVEPENEDVEYVPYEEDTTDYDN